MRRNLAISIFLVLLLLYAWPVHALNHDLLTNISYSYHAGFWVAPEGSSNTPPHSQTHSVSGVGEGPHVSYSYDSPVIDDPTRFKAEIYPYCVLAEKFNYQFDLGAIEARAEWKFIANYENIKVNLKGYALNSTNSGSGRTEFSLSLYDYTDSQYIADVIREVNTGPANEAEDYYSKNYLLEKAHTYGLKLGGIGDWDDYAKAKASARFSVPEPATMVLLCTGMIVLVLRQRRKSIII